MGVVQEKFQVNNPQNRNDDSESGWKSDKSARVTKGVPGKDRPGNSRAENAYLYNSLPPGMDITDQEMADVREMPMAGCRGTGSQVTDDVTAMSMRQGFDRKSLRPTDDMYTREHNDAFYDSVTVDGVEGYVERNNTLDRM
jgi:hypothetical protein